MINQARTLILNEAPLTRPPLGAYGEEYVPAEYAVHRYSSAMESIRNSLIGSFSDPLYQNYRLAQLLAVAHANDYANEYFLSLDSRITYDPVDSGFDASVSGIVIDPATNSAMQLRTSDTGKANDSIGRALFQWRMTALAGPVVSAHDLQNGSTKTYDLTIDNEYSNFFTLDNGLSVQLYVPTGSWAIDVSWILSSMYKPGKDISEIVASLSRTSVAEVMDGASSNATGLWKYGPVLPDKLSGVLMAFVEKANTSAY